MNSLNSQQAGEQVQHPHARKFSGQAIYTSRICSCLFSSIRLIVIVPSFKHAFLFTFASHFINGAMATSRTTAPSGALAVGSGGKYAIVQKAVDSLSKTSTSAQSIFILSGTYKEQATTSSLKDALTVYGYTTNTASYTSNVVTITHSSSRLSEATDDEHTGTVINLSAKTTFYNINIKNIYGKGSQAITLAAYNTEQGCYGVGLYGYQDTLLAQTGLQFYGKCYIEGAVDFIFGQSAIAWIDGSTIAVSAASQGAITASGGAASSSTSYYKSTVGAKTGVSITAGSIFLGRPWGVYARAIFQNTFMSSIINSAGWEVWSASNTCTGGVTMEGYGNNGTGASGTRASFAKKISSALSIKTILGSTYTSWVNTAYVS